MAIDFLMTATCRPKIIRNALASFSSMLINNAFDSRVLYLNVDPVPVGANRKKVVRVCEEFFGTVVCRQPKKPNFSLAQQWCFSASCSELVFNLQDDWNLLKRVDLEEMARLLLDKHKLDDRIVQAKLPYRPNATRSKLFLSPSLMMGDFCRSFAKRMVPERNPEVQLRSQGTGRSFIYPAVQGSIVKDIGRKWLKEHGFSRAYTGSRRLTFVRWDVV